MGITVEALDAARWRDLEALFHAKGCSMARGCWCMYYRETAATASADRAARRRALLDLAGRDPAVGLLAYEDGAAVGWVALSPRTEYPRLTRSPVAKAVDDAAVWSLVCFVVPSAQRGRGVARALLDAAVAYARAHGAPALEAYPVDKDPAGDAAWLWNGPMSSYRKAGFVEVARRRPQRPVVRRVFRGLDAGSADGAVAAGDAPDPRPALLEHLHEELGAWERLLARLDVEALHAARSDAGWSIRDVLAHLGGWQAVTLARLRAAASGGAPAFPAWRGERSPATRAELDAVNATLHDLHQGTPWPAVLAEWRGGYAELVAHTARLPLDDLTTVGRFEGLPRHALTAVIDATVTHHAGHRTSVERWLATPAPSRPPTA